MFGQHSWISSNSRRQQSRRHDVKKCNAKRKRFSENLSTEAQIAMRLAYQDTLELKSQATESLTDVNSELESTITYSKMSQKESTPSCDSCAEQVPVRKLIKTGSAYSFTPSIAPSVAPSFSELYERNKSSRMSRDITDETFDVKSQARRPLGGGAKLESAYEIIEVVNYDKPQLNWNEEAMKELANLNSMDKCLVWMQAIDTQPDNSGLSDPDD